jgi:hypothetical protein
MAFEIPDHFHKSFTTNVELLLQQEQSALMGAVNMSSFSGEAAQVVKQFGEVAFAEKTGRGDDTTWSTIEHKQRWMHPTDYVLALPVDTEDELRMLDSPMSPYARAMRAAWARQIDAVIRDAALGVAYTGKNGSTSTAFDTANSQIAASATGLTIAKLRTARKKLRAAQVDMSEQLFIAVTAEEIDDLLATTEVTSADYNTVKALVGGDIDTFMGFKFIHYEGLGVDGSSARRVIAWAKSGIVLGQWNGLTTNIGPRPDKNYTNQIHMKGTLGATRTHEKKVLEILCA